MTGRLTLRTSSDSGNSGGAEQFCAPKLGGGPTYMDLDYYNVFESAGYSIVQNNTELQAASNSDRLLGIFSISNMAKCTLNLRSPQDQTLI